MQVFGEFYGFLSLSLFGWKAADSLLSDFSSLFFFLFCYCFASEILVLSHTVNRVCYPCSRWRSSSYRPLGKQTINDAWITIAAPFSYRHSVIDFFFTPFRLFLLLTKSLFRYRLLHCLGWSHSFQDFRRKINSLLFIFPSPLYSQPSIRSFIHSSTRHTIVLECLYISWGRHSHVLHLQLHRLFYSPF